LKKLIIILSVLYFHAAAVSAQDTAPSCPDVTSQPSAEVPFSVNIADFDNLFTQKLPVTAIYQINSDTIFIINIIQIII